MSAWIRMISDENADGELKDALALSRTPHGTVDNVLRVHSLRPATMRGHILLYRSILHDDANRLPNWLQECIGSYVSIINNCPYSLANHWANAVDLLDDDVRAATIEAALKAQRPEDAFEGRELALMHYAHKLTLTPAAMVEADVEALRDAGFDDGQILEANQIICYFNYVNRSINGLGVTTKGDIVGYYAKR